ncbi:branched-chain amino acid ABC transporter ATP-binding protein/permease [soil metagenome]
MTRTETIGVPARSSRLKSALLPIGWVVISALLIFAPSLHLVNALWMRQIMLVALLALVVSGLNLSFGFAGELSFASAAMYAAGAYATGYLAMSVVNDLALALVISAVVGLVLGLLSGIPGLRLGGWMLATASFFLVLLVPDVVNIFKAQLGGSQGMAGIPLAKIFGFELGDTGLYVAAIIVTSIWFVLFRNLAISRTGRALSVLRQSPILASSLGMSVYGLKLKAYALAGLPAALAGTFFAYLDGFLAPDLFALSFSIAVLAASILGGKRSIYGVFIGAAIMQLGPMNTAIFGNYAFIAYGVLLVAVGVLLPGGIAGLVQQIRTRIRGRAGKRSTVRRSSDTAVIPVLEPLNGQKLEVSGVSKRFGGVQALTEVSFEANPGEVVALIGPNGSGKTTLLNVISGFYKIDVGEVRLGGAKLSGKSSHRIAQSGVMRTFQTPLVAELTVRDTVATARFSTDRASIVETMLRLPRYTRAVRRDRSEVDAVLAATGLSDVANEDATALPLGTRRILELARALAGNPSLVLLDEVASGLDEEEIQALSEVIRAIRAAGGTVLLVEHNFALVRDLADRVVVLSQGKLVTQGPPEEIATHPEVLQHYLGEAPVETAPAGVYDVDDVVGEAEHFLGKGASTRE